MRGAEFNSTCCAQPKSIALRKDKLNQPLRDEETDEPATLTHVILPRRQSLR